MVVLLISFNAKGLGYALTFFRDTNKNEIDLIIESGGKTIPVEIKASETMNNRFFDTVIWFQKQIKSNQEGIVVYGGDKTQKRSRGKVVSWRELEKVFLTFH